MKVLFLDIDGVVNCSSDFDPQSDGYRLSGGYPLNTDMIERVRHIVNSTGCKIVLSSSWRLSPNGRAAVEQHFELFDMTPDKRGLTDRGCEVIAWLEQHPEVEAHAILDDNTDFHKEQPLFKTDWTAGLTSDIADRVVNHLGVA